MRLIVSKKLNKSDKELLNQLNELKNRFTLALSNDFDTPEALRVVLDAILLANNAIMESLGKRDLPVEVLCTIASFVVDACELFGLERMINAYKPSIQLNIGTQAMASSFYKSQNTENVGNMPSPEALLDIFTAFRAEIRKNALNNQDNSELRTEILRICDEIR